MLKQHGSRCRIGILIIYIFLMIAVCSSSPIHQHIRRDTDKRNCNSGRDHYQGFCYGPRADGNRREDDVQKCFDKLYNSYKWNSSVGRLSINEGRCRCTVNKLSKWRWEETFKKARASLHRQCCGFAYYVMGSYEGDMRLTVTCI